METPDYPVCPDPRCCERTADGQWHLISYAIRCLAAFDVGNPVGLSIHYSANYLGENVIFDCLLSPNGVDGWTTSSCSICQHTMKDWEHCISGEPVRLDGSRVDAALVSNLLTATSELEPVEIETKCFHGTDNYPDYNIVMSFDEGAPIEISIGSNCGPFFVTQGSVIGCDCSTTVYDALWAIFAAVAPMLPGTVVYPHSPDENCSCFADFP